MTAKELNAGLILANQEQRVAVIAGGTSGVGLACARILLSTGVDQLAIIGRDSDRAQHVAKGLSMEYPSAVVRAKAADVGTVEGAQQAVASTVTEFGHVDLLICSTVPAEAVPELLARTPIHDVEDTLTRICLPPLLLTRAVLPHMQDYGTGSIVLVASDAAKVSTPGETVIGAAMSAITMFTRATALELKRNNIRVNCVTPSLIADTPTSERVRSGAFSARIFDKAAQLAELGVPTAHEVAQLVCHLGGTDSARVTGQVVSINGGISTG